VTSQAFAVSPAPSLRVSAPAVAGSEIRVTLSYVPRPDNYRVIDALVRPEQVPPVRAGSVTFTDGTTTLVDASPDIVAGNPPTAVYSVDATGLDLGNLAVSGADPWGNTTP
jgi:hypothetical protein